MKNYIETVLELMVMERTGQMVHVSKKETTFDPATFAPSVPLMCRQEGQDSHFKVQYCPERVLDHLSSQEVDDDLFELLCRQICDNVIGEKHGQT